MPHKRFLAVLGAGLLLGACSVTVRGPASRPTAQLGTVAPAYQVGDELSPGITVIDHIPLEKLSTSGTVALDSEDMCRGIPGSVVAPAGFNPNPEHRTGQTCGWVTSGMALALSNSPPVSMVETVTEHIDAAHVAARERSRTWPGCESTATTSSNGSTDPTRAAAVS